MMPLNLIKDSLLELTLNLLARVVLARLAVETEEGTKVELGCLEELDLSDVDLCAGLVFLVMCEFPCEHLRSGEGRCPGWPSQSRDQ